ncbi:MAG: hypothetical protein JWR62_2479, partial [Modestobacter sp.]|nr:hypothetical protein [Modestobacter sp.]
MSDPGTGEHSVRSLAEILREHGLESEFGTRPGRRRKDDEPKANWPARPGPGDERPSKLRPGGAGTGAGAAPARPAQAPGTPPGPPGRPEARPAAVTQASLAESLRQHGLETEFGTRPGRRRGGAKADWPAP